MWLNPRKWHRSFFENRGYPRSVVTNSQRRTQGISHERALGNSERGHRTPRRADKVPLVLTYHPKNQEVKKIFLKNFRILTDDPTTKEIFNTTPLCVYRRDAGLRDILVHSTLSSRADDTQATIARTFPCPDPSAVHATSQDGQRQSPTPTEMFG